MSRFASYSTKKLLQRLEEFSDRLDNEQVLSGSTVGQSAAVAQQDEDRLMQDIEDIQVILINRSRAGDSSVPLEICQIEFAPTVECIDLGQSLCPPVTSCCDNSCGCCSSPCDNGKCDCAPANSKPA